MVKKPLIQHLITMNLEIFSRDSPEDIIHEIYLSLEDMYTHKGIEVINHSQTEAPNGMAPYRFI
jgi:hypothetical protein